MKRIISFFQEYYVITTIGSMILMVIVAGQIAERTLVSAGAMFSLALGFGLVAQFAWKRFVGPPEIRPLISYAVQNVIRFGLLSLCLMLWLNYVVPVSTTYETHSYTTVSDTYSTVWGESFLCTVKLDGGAYKHDLSTRSLECDRLHLSGIVVYRFDTGIFGMKTLKDYWVDDEISSEDFPAEVAN